MCSPQDSETILGYWEQLTRAHKIGYFSSSLKCGVEVSIALSHLSPRRAAFGWNNPRRLASFSQA